MASNSATVYVGSVGADEGQTQKAVVEDKLEELASRAGLIIFEVTTKPSLFSARTTLTICPNRVTISKKGMFSREEYPMAIENVTNARVFTHFRRASLEFETFGIPKPDVMKGLRVDDARLARRYILALIECKKNNIDLNYADAGSLRDRLKEIGMVRHSSDEGDYHRL